MLWSLELQFLGRVGLMVITTDSNQFLNLVYYTLTVITRYRKLAMSASLTQIGGATSTTELLRHIQCVVIGVAFPDK